jgi:hypothetical protein
MAKQTIHSGNGRMSDSLIDVLPARRFHCKHIQALKHGIELSVQDLQTGGPARLRFATQAGRFLAVSQKTQPHGPPQVMLTIALAWISGSQEVGNPLLEEGGAELHRLSGSAAHADSLLALRFTVSIHSCGLISQTGSWGPSADVDWPP